MFFLRFVLRNVFRAKLRAALTILGLVIAILAFGLLQTVVRAWYAGSDAASATRLITRNSISLTFTMPMHYREKIRAMPGVTGISVSNWFGGIYKEPKNFFAQFAVYSTYTDPPQSLFPKKIKAGFIYTMGISEEMMKEWGYIELFKRHEMILTRIYGSSEYMCSFDTCQFDDYSKVLATRFDPVKKAQRRKEIFPIDCQRAFDMGARFATIEK